MVAIYWRVAFWILAGSFLVVERRTGPLSGLLAAHFPCRAFLVAPI
jgi:hypothetical protein